MTSKENPCNLRHLQNLYIPFKQKIWCMENYILPKKNHRVVLFHVSCFTIPFHNFGTKMCNIITCQAMFQLQNLCKKPVPLWYQQITESALLHCVILDAVITLYDKPYGCVYVIFYQLFHSVAETSPYLRNVIFLINWLPR